MEINTKKLKSLKTRFEKEYCLKRLDLNEECIRADVIKVLQEHNSHIIPETIFGKLYLMDSTEKSIKLINEVINKYYKIVEKRWLLELLLELQKLSVNKYKNFIKKKINPYKLLENLLGNLCKEQVSFSLSSQKKTF